VLTAAGRPDLGNVHLGPFLIPLTLVEASGTYLPGPTELGVAVLLMKLEFGPPYRLKPNVYLGSFFISGLSFGRYCGPGVRSIAVRGIYSYKSYSWLSSDFGSARVGFSRVVC
jgi:hypothetical protein